MDPEWIAVWTAGSIVACTFVGWAAYKIGYANASRDENKEDG